MRRTFSLAFTSVRHCRGDHCRGNRGHLGKRADHADAADGTEASARVIAYVPKFTRRFEIAPDANGFFGAAACLPKHADQFQCVSRFRRLHILIGMHPGQVRFGMALKQQ